MSTNKIVVISRKNLAGLQCYVQQTPAAGQLQTASYPTADTGNAALRSSSSSFNTSGGVGAANAVVSPTTDVVTGAAQLETVVTTHEDNGEQSGEEYSSSFPDNDEELGHGELTPMDMQPHLQRRYVGLGVTGMRGGVGKCIIYKDGVQRDLTVQEVVDILANPDLSKLSTMPPIRPRGGTMYLYRCPDYETRHDIRADQYLWSQQGAKKMPKDDPIIKRYYMYVRTHLPIKNVSKRPKKTFTRYDVRFKKAEYELIDGEDPLVLVHYTGDESVWKPFRHGNAIKTDRPFVRRMSSGRRNVLNVSSVGRPREVYQGLHAPATDGYDMMATPRDKDQIRSYLKFHGASRLRGRGERASTSSRKRRRLTDDGEGGDPDYQDETHTAADALGMDTGYLTGQGGLLGAARRETAGGESYDAPTMIAEEEGVVNAVDLRSKFDGLWPTFDVCQNSRMHGFVNSMIIVPQVVVTAASKNLLNVANDLAQLDQANKTDRFEFYYVSAGPVAGGYYLSTLLFRHCLFDTEPIVPAAFLIHERRNPGDHRRLFELIKNKCPDVASADCVIITDREFGAISSVLPSAIQLYSWHYFEDDIINWVENNGGTNDEANVYLNDVSSLMKMKTVEYFNRELALKRRHWPPAFSNFFDTCMKADILSKGGRWNSDALEGGVYDPFCGVVIPSCNYLNQLVGDLVEWNEASLDQLLQCMYHFSEYYVREIERSMHQLGEYKLQPRFAHYARPMRRLRAFAGSEVADPRNIVHHVRMHGVQADRGVVITENV